MTRFNAKKLMDEWIKSQDCQYAACNISIYRFLLWHGDTENPINIPGIASKPKIYLIIDFLDEEKSVWAVDFTKKSLENETLLIDNRYIHLCSFFSKD